MSGFLFCGIMEDPVVKPSERRMKRYSQLDHRTISSLSRDRCMANMLMALMASRAKSLSETPSMLFRQGPEKPNSSAVAFLSMG